MIKRYFYLFIIIVASLFLETACSGEDTVLANLSEVQANQVLAILHRYDIVAQKSGSLKSGYAITVEPDESTAALSIINEYQLPWQSDDQFQQSFSNDSLISSPGIELAKLIFLQEQRLEQSLKIIDKVINAKVNISVPFSDNGLSNAHFTEHAAVLITYSGDIDENIFANRIKLLVKNSLDNIQFENISVVLFHAPEIQYTPPLKLQSSVADRQSVILVVIFFVLCVVVLVGCLFWKNKKAQKNDEREKS
ncbi:EscJ/YscJ/HrcJ family type III secretion inner membrane ring protein [Salmonella enterica]|nr:EscJ/YscJ/HrcJ family type III secretion inner membrane ring protein [Salmonella enterica]EKF0976911.1 type III secretion inner membrane ring lipoprotein SctJ [Salmonella enterica]